MHPPASTHVIAAYEMRATARTADARAQALAIEQSIEMPVQAVTDARVVSEVMARVVAVAPRARGVFRVELALAPETIGGDAGQLMNMLFGNTSLAGDVRLVDIDVPAALAAGFGGPAVGIDGLRQLTGVPRRALTCSALKPIGSSVDDLARMARVFAGAGIDVIKDDHGWADQASAPFTARVAACLRAVATADQRRDGAAVYAPSLSGTFEQMRRQIRFAVDHGARMVLIAPMVCGVANFHALRREFGEVAFLAHPALGGAQIAPAALLGKLYRLFGADAVIFPNHGGRFPYSRATCAAIAANQRAPWHGLKAALPTPAGGMSVERAAGIVAQYGTDTMLLVGGSLLAARDALAGRAREFVAAVAAASAAQPLAAPEAMAASRRGAAPVQPAATR